MFSTFAQYVIGFPMERPALFKVRQVFQSISTTWKFFLVLLVLKIENKGKKHRKVRMSGVHRYCNCITPCPKITIFVTIFGYIVVNRIKKTKRIACDWIFGLCFSILHGLDTTYDFWERRNILCDPTCGLVVSHYQWECHFWKHRISHPSIFWLSLWTCGSGCFHWEETSCGHFVDICCITFRPRLPALWYISVLSVFRCLALPVHPPFTLPNIFFPLHWSCLNLPS